MASKQKNVKIKTSIFRASFANVFEPRAFHEKQEPKYSVQMLFKKDDPDFLELKRAIIKARKEKWPNKTPGVYNSPIKDGDGKKLKDYKGMWAIEARTKHKPQIIDRQGNEITDEADFYSGCWAKATVSVYTWEQPGKCGVSLALGSIIKIKDDESLGGRANANDEFADELSESEDDEENEDEDDAEEEDDEEEEPAPKKKPAKKKKINRDDF